MNTRLEDDTHKSPEALEQEINARREHISGLVDALEQRFTPGQLIDQALSYTKGHGGEFFHNLGTTLKHNPLPATLTAVGLAWLAINQNRPFNPGPAHHGPGLGEKLGEAMDSVKGAFAHAGDTLHDTGHDLRKKAHDLRDSVTESTEGLRHTAHQASDQAGALKGQFDHLLKEQPLVLAALGIALGAALGAALPSTRQEDRVMGQASDELTDSLKHKSQQAKDAVKQATHDEPPAQTDLSSGLGFGTQR